MADYDYGNARLHVMKSRLLSSRELETLVNTGSLQGLIAALTKTVYQKSVEAALTRAIGMQCIDEALRNDLVGTIGKIRGFYMESAGKMVAILLQTYDIHNLKEVLRGLSKNVPAGIQRSKEKANRDDPPSRGRSPLASRAWGGFLIL